MFKTLSSKVALLTGLVATLAVLIAGLVSMSLVREATEAQAQTTLAEQADLVQEVASNPADFASTSDVVGSRALFGLISYLKTQHTEVFPVIRDSNEPQVLSVSELKQIYDGQSVSGRYCADDQCFLIEGRPVGLHTGIVLVQPTEITARIKSEALTRIFIALIVGLSIAIVIGLIAANRFIEPLRKAAQAAHSMAKGKRNVQLAESGPSEISEIAIALNALAAELDHSESRQREFLLSISHELRTPLTAIRGYAEAMNDGVITDKEVQTVGEIVNAEAIRLDRLVADLLDLARSGAVDFPLHITRIDLRDVVAEASKVWKDRAEREGVNFRSELPSNSIFVLTDPVRIRQILDNLAENALRVTPTSQLIIFELTQAGKLEVRDTGPGLSPEDIDVAFKPGELYERFKGVRRVGTGFGLALVARLAQRLGVLAHAGIAPEGGAAFSIDFGPLISQ